MEERFKQYALKKDQRLQDIERELGRSQEERTKQVSFVNDKSKKILARSKNKKQSGLSVEDRLMRQGMERTRQLEQ
jgi:hypothetical protein